MLGGLEQLKRQNMANGYQFILPEQVSETQHKYTHSNLSAVWRCQWRTWLCSLAWFLEAPPQTPVPRIGNVGLPTQCCLLYISATPNPIPWQVGKLKLSCICHNCIFIDSVKAECSIAHLSWYLLHQLLQLVSSLAKNKGCVKAHH